MTGSPGRPQPATARPTRRRGSAGDLQFFPLLSLFFRPNAEAGSRNESHCRGSENAAPMIRARSRPNEHRVSWRAVECLGHHWRTSGSTPRAEPGRSKREGI